METILNRLRTGLQELFPAMGDFAISAETRLGDIPDWDSMGAVNFQLFLEQEFHFSIPQDFLGEETTIRDVMAFIENPDTISMAV